MLTLRMNLPPLATSPQAARHVVAYVTEQLHGCAAAEVAALVTSELVTNAIRYGEAPVALHLEIDEGDVYLEVEDASPVPPRVEKRALGQGGLGMMVVSGVAETWGVRSGDEGGKVVWCHLPVH